MDEQEYYATGAGYVRIWSELVDRPDYVVVMDANSDYGELSVIPRSDLKKKEDSYEYEQAEKRKKEIQLITANAKENLDKLVDEITDKALSSLSTRIKMNVLFGKLGGDDAIMLAISKELEDLVKENAPEVIKKEKDIF